MAPVTGHSAKPESFLEMLEQYFPTLPKIELNRRGPPRQGWNAFGNEVVSVADNGDDDAQASADARKAAYAAIDEAGMTADPLKKGIPVFLQTQNRDTSK